MNASSVKKTLFFDALTATIAWFAIVMQAFLTTGSMGNLFSYFTILTNLLIAVSLTVQFFGTRSRLYIFFKNASVRSAITLYIFIVALVYNTVLRGIVTLNGWNLLVDTLLHVIVPILYIIGWFIYVPKGILQWKNGISWIFFPLGYLIYSLIRGAIYGWYPYPFLNVNDLGYPKVFINIAMMILVFFAAGLCLIKLNQALKNKSSQ